VSAVILVVDDNPANLKLACDLLECEGHEVLRADGAERALEILERRRPDLILMDLSMPGMDGLTLTRRLKADPRTRDLVVVALTASAMSGDEDRVMAAGCDGYISKPIDTRVFPEQVAGFCRAPERSKQILVVDDSPTNRKLL
jgi:CheY-like chemotaxis protein